VVHPPPSPKVRVLRLGGHRLTSSEC
jgi:hypothetical protein